jgi:hypothetical protein
MQCSFIPPVRGKRRRIKAPKEGLHAKLRRYEELLKSYGADIEPSDNGDVSDVEKASEADVQIHEDADPGNKKRGGPITFDETNRRLITKNGTTRYFDKYACCCFKILRG